MRVRRIENAVVLTMDAKHPCATSIDLADGVIVGIDQPDDGRGDGEVLDIRGAVVVPGFIDSHLHLLSGGRSLATLDLSAARSRDEFERAVAERHARLPQGAWLEGGGWSEVNWRFRPAEGQPAREPDDTTHLAPVRELPDRTWLRSCGTRPAILYRMDHHVCVVNETVLELLKHRGMLDRDPPGGRIERDATGRPTGLLVEAAAWMVNALVPQPSVAQRAEALRAASAHLLALGVTSVGTMEYARDVDEVLIDGRGEGVPRLLVTLLDREWPIDVRRALDFPCDDRLQVVGMKSFLDGTLGSRTAAMLEPYEDDPENRGLFVEFALDDPVAHRSEDRVVPRADRLHEWARLVVEAGLSPSMHAIGDAALRLALDVADALPRTAPIRIEHAQTVAPEDLPRTRGRWLSMQPLHKADDARVVMNRLGARRLDRFFPFRALLDHGALLAFGSDWPIVSPDPLLGVRAATSGATVDGAIVAPEQNLPVIESLAAYTVNAASMFGKERIGVLKPGCVADLAVLAGPLEEPSPHLLCTVVAGALRHVADGAGVA